jgi:hypothetical protein
MITPSKEPTLSTSAPLQSASQQKTRRNSDFNLSFWAIIGAGLSALSIISLVVYFTKRKQFDDIEAKLKEPVKPNSTIVFPITTIRVKESTTAPEEYSIPAVISSPSLLASTSASMNTILFPKPSSYKFPAFIVPLVSLVLLFVTQYIFNFAYWFDLDLTPIAFLNPVACIWPYFCNELRFPPFGFIALLAALVASILFGTWLAWQKVPNILNEPGFIPSSVPHAIPAQPSS